ncbi:tRNA threonylcarbamoyladenosine dehydratase [Selenomonadales bacterium OttesenSCG-928-I06]|nr:tRNA threonylcarbamoyladenosine dehydratase [Selenomonadales bacterium OttesenSCG-928-I06]
MKDEFSRTEILIGKDNLEKIKCSKIAVFGIGGVGTFVVEGLVRSGVTNITLVDFDKIVASNINRQIIATQNTIGLSKVAVMKDRILSINPNASVTIIEKMYTEENSSEFFQEEYDYIIDAIDTVRSKIDLIVQAKKKNIKIISSLGTGNKLDPTCFEVADIYDTTVCPLARILRKELKIRQIPSLKVVYSKEEPKIFEQNSIIKENGKNIVGSISFVPSVAGLIIAGEVIKDIIST